MITTRRIACLARAEAVLLRRNPSALGGALIAPLTLAVVPFSNPEASGLAGSGTAVVLVVGLTAFTLILGVYYNLVTALVARREEFVLKRLRTGEIGDAEILAGTAAPAVLIAWAQIALGIVVGFALLDLEMPTNPGLVLVGVGLGTAACILFAAAVTVVTSTVEMAQLTATPVLFVSLIFSGAMFPLDTLPDPLARLAGGLPLTQVVDLVRIGLVGASPGEAAVPVLVLGAWLMAGTLVVRRWFRWEPRR
jgi:ABC-2 type transport system permease protein